MGEFDPAPGAVLVPPDDEFAPAPGAALTPPPAPAAAEAPKPSLLSRVASQVAQPFKDIGHGVMEANRAVTHAIFHPVETARGIGSAIAHPIKGTSGAREFLRGVNDNIPFANTAVQAIGGPAESSPEDAAAAPGARAVGGVAGAPIGGELLGGIAAKVAEKAAPVVARAVSSIGESAEARQIARTKEALELKVNKGTRAGLKSDAVDQVIAESPELQKAAGKDEKVAQFTERLKTNAGTTLDQIYTASPAARAAAASDLQELEAKAKAARGRADRLAARQGPSPAATPGGEAGAGAAPLTPSQLAKLRADPEAAAWEGHPDATENPLSLPNVKPAAAPEAPASGASWSAHSIAADEAKAEADSLEAQVAAKRKTAGSASSPPHVDAAAPLSAIDRRISALKSTKLPNDAAAAASLGKIRDKLAESIGEDGTLDPRKLRQIQSDYQREGYAKNLNEDPEVSARIRANREASKAVGDVIVEHVTGMKYAEAKAAAASDPNSLAAKLFKANDHISAAHRIDAGIADRASRVQPPTVPMAAVKRVASHAVGPALMGATHGPVAGVATAVGQELLHAAPGALRAGASAIDSGIASAAPRVASALTGIGQAASGGTMLQRVQAAAQAGNPRAAKLLAALRGAGAPGAPAVGAATSGTLATQ